MHKVEELRRGPDRLRPSLHLLLDLAGRGPSRSLPFEAIRDAVAREIDRGAKEIVLTGVDITDYEGGLGTLCQRLLAAEPRPAAPAPVLARQHRDRRCAVRADRRRAAADAALPSVAAGRRRHDPQADEAPPQPRRGGRARSSGSRPRGPTRRSAPTSSPAFRPKPKRWRSTACNLLDDCDIIAAHIFPFSPRPNTPAARMPQVAARAGQGPRGAASRGRGRSAARAGSTAWSARRQPVLIEGDGTGHTDNFAPVARRRGDARRSSGTSRITGRDGDQLIGRSGHELARPPARRVSEDRRQGRRQSHRPGQPSRRSTPRRSTRSRRR